MKPIHVLALGLVFLLTACTAATQNIPVSSNPDGAAVYADGKEVGTTPCNVTLEKTQPHILTVKKDGYHQVDVQITRKYDTATVARDATRAGMWTSSNGANTQGAVSNALMNVSADEQSGDAYVLSPASVVIKLKPVKQVSQASGGQSPVVISPDQLDPADRAKVTGQEPVVISPDQLDPADRAKVSGQEQADVQTTEPATLGGAVSEDPAAAAGAALEGAAVAAPTVGAKTSTKSSHSSESYGPGSYSKKTTTTKTSVGVSVNPVEAGLGVMKLLQDQQSKEAQPEAAE
jgi:hypothetical protein